MLADILMVRKNGKKTSKRFQPKECGYRIFISSAQTKITRDSDAIALNIGSSSWQRDRVRDAYTVAARLSSSSPMKLFFSFDFAEMACDVNDIISRTREFANHPAQFMVNGKVFVSSFSGDCLGNDGWQRLKSETNAYLMPFVWGQEGRFNQWPALDSWYWYVAICATIDHSLTDDHAAGDVLGLKGAVTRRLLMMNTVRA